MSDSSDSSDEPKEKSPILHVNIGQLKAGRAPNVLKATLGSCVGIGFLWRDRKTCGLAHCLLPLAPKQSFELSAKYVSHAVPSLMKLMRVREENLKEIEVIIVGGSHMTADSQAAKSGAIGDMNAEAARKYVEAAGLKVIFAQFGGDRGRQISIDCSTFEFNVRLIEKGA